MQPGELTMDWAQTMIDRERFEIDHYFLQFAFKKQQSCVAQQSWVPLSILFSLQVLSLEAEANFPTSLKAANALKKQTYRQVREEGSKCD